MTPEKHDQGDGGVRCSARIGDWLPIETAPKDRMILLYRPTAIEWGKITLGKWQSDEYAKKPKPYWEGWLKIGVTLQWRAWVPTHWMDLPKSPTEKLMDGATKTVLPASDATAPFHAAPCSPSPE